MKDMIRELLQQHDCVKIAALGSSNTQRRVTGMHWFDYLELALKAQFGKGAVLCCNMGVGGETSGQILERFDRDCGAFRQHLTIITCGGNDSYPAHNVSEKEFADNLRELHRRCRQIGSEVIFQSYYGCDLARLEKDYAPKLVNFMQIIREVADECGAYLHDNFARWEPLRRNETGLYRMLMIDNLHVNDHGNAVMGLDLLRAFDLDVPEMINKHAAAGVFAQKCIDLMQ